MKLITVSRIWLFVNFEFPQRLRTHFLVKVCIAEGGLLQTNVLLLLYNYLWLPYYMPVLGPIRFKPMILVREMRDIILPNIELWYKEISQVLLSSCIQICSSGWISLPPLYLYLQSLHRVWLSTDPILFPQKRNKIYNFLETSKGFQTRFEIRFKIGNEFRISTTEQLILFQYPFFVE